jgi:hypothetical protein
MAPASKSITTVHLSHICLLTLLAFLMAALSKMEVIL